MIRFLAFIGSISLTCWRVLSNRLESYGQHVGEYSPIKRTIINIYNCNNLYIRSLYNKHQLISMTEQELICLCKKREKSALKLLYDRYAPGMMGICMRYTGNEENSKDILHDCFVKIFESIDRFEYLGAGSLKGWLSRITVNASLTFLQKQSCLVPMDEYDLPDRSEERRVGKNVRQG